MVKGKEGLKVEDKNVDGAVRDQDTFVLGDDDDEENDDDQDSATGKPSALNDFSASATGAADEQESQEVNKADAEQPKELDPDSTTPRRAQYHIKRGDTLQGIIFKFGANREELCRLNRLPLSTLTTTPHLLHTRTVLLLPSSARITSKENITFLDEATPSRTEEDEKRAVRRAREKAEKRLQTVTKEVDWAVAKAYVALAETPGEEEAYALKMKEQPSARIVGGSSLEAVAVDRYLDDLEWEANEFKAGRGVSIPRVPPSMKI
ncbi:hypothetical protein V5O48_011738 [Marasmius crinis-equi]|uniref:LysM domain-containing protein n=1 Tax=Marasmius crinis-equi TaxID=585013 RepID=A0ABR3F4S0_9AGAR